MCNASEYECQEPWLWMTRLSKNDFEHQKKEILWLQMLDCTTALNAKTKTNDSPKLGEMTLNA